MSAERAEFEAALLGHRAASADYQESLHKDTTSADRYQLLTDVHGFETKALIIFDRIVGERDAAQTRAGIAVGVISDLRAERDAAIKEARLTSLKHTPEYETTRTDSELASLFDHMGYADGDAGYLLRYFSYGDGARIKQVFAERDAALKPRSNDEEFVMSLQAERDAAIARAEKYKAEAHLLNKERDAAVADAKISHENFRDAVSEATGHLSNERDALRAEVARHVAFGSRLQDDVLQLTAELAGLNETERLNGMQHSIDTLMADNERLRTALESVQHNRTCSCYVTMGQPCARCVVGFDDVDAALAPRATEGR